MNIEGKYHKVAMPQSNGFKLMDDSHTYYGDFAAENKLRWRCSKRAKQKCSRFFYTNNECTVMYDTDSRHSCQTSVTASGAVPINRTILIEGVECDVLSVIKDQLIESKELGIQQVAECTIVKVPPQPIQVKKAVRVQHLSTIQPDAQVLQEMVEQTLRFVEALPEAR